MPNSSDCAPCDFWLFGYLKRKIREREVTTLAQLKSAIRRAVKEIPLEIVNNVLKAWPRRVLAVYNAKGGHIKNCSRILWDKFSIKFETHVINLKTHCIALSESIFRVKLLRLILVTFIRMENYILVADVVASLRKYLIVVVQEIWYIQKYKSSSGNGGKSSKLKFVNTTNSLSLFSTKY